MNEYESKAEIAKKVCEIIADHLGLNAPIVATDLEVSVMKDLGADSLDVVELAMEFELTFNLQYNDYSSESLEDVIGEGTINDIVNHIYIVTRDAVTTTEAVTPELKIPMEVPVVSFRNEIMERIRKHVAFYETFHTSRFKPAQDFLIEKRSPSTLLSSKQRRKIQIELDEMAYLDDIELLDFYEIIIRCWSKQM